MQPIPVVVVVGATFDPLYCIVIYIQGFVFFSTRSYARDIVAWKGARNNDKRVGKH